MLGIYGEQTDVPLVAFAEGLDLLGVRYQWRSVNAWSSPSDAEGVFTAILLHGVRNPANRACYSAYALRGVPVLVVDLGYIKRASRHDRQGHYYIGLNGLGIVPQIKRPRDRLDLLGVKLGDHTRNSNIALILGQVPGDQSHGLDAIELLQCYASVAQQLSDLGFKPVYRPHPGATDLMPDNVILAPNVTIEELAHIACLAVTVSSNSGLDCLIQGTPAASLMPCHWSEVGLTWPLQSFADIKAPDEVRMLDFLARLAYCQWTPEEMRRGLAQQQLIEDGLLPIGVAV